MYQICLRAHRQDYRKFLQRGSAKYQPILSLRQLNLKLKYVDTDHWPNNFSMAMFMALCLATGYLIAYVLAICEPLTPYCLLTLFG